MVRRKDSCPAESLQPNQEARGECLVWLRETVFIEIHKGFIVVFPVRDGRIRARHRIPSIAVRGGDPKGDHRRQ